MRNIAQMQGNPLSPTELEALARQNGWSLAALCRESGVAASNFTRWKNGANGMTFRTYERVYRVASQKRIASPGRAA